MSDLALLYNVDGTIFDQLDQIKRNRSDGPYYQIVKLLNSIRYTTRQRLQNLITSSFVTADVDEIKKLETHHLDVGTLNFDWSIVQNLAKETLDYLESALISVHANVLRAKRNYTDPFAPEQKPLNHLVSLVKEGGRTYNSSLGNYANLVLDTAKKKAETAAVVRRAKLSKLGLTKVSESAKVESGDCEQYAGKVYSVGNNSQYPPLSSLPNGGPPFHPWCSKKLSIYIE